MVVGGGDGWYLLETCDSSSRNHNSIGQSSQEPYVFSEAAQLAMRQALLTRYTLLPYLYTLFYQAHTTGSLVAAPLLYAFPTVPETWAIDRQFLWGEGLLVSPVLEEGATSVSAYFPPGVWYACSATTVVRFYSSARRLPWSLV